MKAIVGGRLVLPDRVLTGCALLFDDTIRDITDENALPADCEIMDAAGALVLPGLIDLHIHGYLGGDASDGDAAGLQKMADGLLQNGVTGFCPTTMTLPLQEIDRAFEVIRTVQKKAQGARILGANCEGPFLSPAKAGAQRSDWMLPPDADFILKNADLVRLVTVAPEVPGAADFCARLYADGRVKAAIGHTDATFEQANAVIEQGACHATHLFNAMSPLTHRKPGVVGAVLSSDRVTCELIADTFHVSKDIFPLVAALKPNRLCLITDCMRAGGMPDGHYTLGGQPVTKQGIQCLLPDGTIAGSVLTLNRAVRNLYKNTALSLPAAVACATAVPAAVLKRTDLGSIAVGKAADFALCDDDFNIKKTILKGEICYEQH